jgi:hypothetical protein
MLAEKARLRALPRPQRGRASSSVVQSAFAILASELDAIRCGICAYQFERRDLTARYLAIADRYFSITEGDIRRGPGTDSVKPTIERTYTQLEIDHVLPYSLGGRLSTANVQVLCSYCNRGKGSSVSAAGLAASILLNGRVVRDDFTDLTSSAVAAMWHSGDCSLKDRECSRELTVVLARPPSCLPWDMQVVCTRHAARV